jgi:methylthioribose-1-phosphate isomerase
MYWQTCWTGQCVCCIIDSQCFCVLVLMPSQVVVAEAGPGYDGHAMASQLSQAKVQTTLIADSAVFAMMARVNKVSVCGHRQCSQPMHQPFKVVTVCQQS